MLKEKIEDFLNSLGYTLKSEWSDKGEGYKYQKKEANGQKLEISVFMGKAGRQTISKRDADSNMYNNYVAFTPLELKFFDSLDFEASYWHNYHTDQTAQDWFNAGEVELKF
jgi:hypothetical protein